MSTPQDPKPQGEPKTRERASEFGASFDKVFEDELACVERRWDTVYTGERKEDAEKRKKGVKTSPTVGNDLVGLAFSGGGIRSATINMGIAQALHRRGVFDHVDYMSTVSGGGYLGSSISTAMREGPSKPEHPKTKGEFPYAYKELDGSAEEAAAAEPGEEGSAEETASGEPREVETKFLTWVRNNSNYMATGGFLDWPRIFGVLLRGILANFLVLLPFLLVFALIMAWYHGDTLAQWEKEDQAVATAWRSAEEAAAEADRALQLGTTTQARAEETRLAAEQAEEAAKKLQEKTAEGRAAAKIFLWVMGFAGLFLFLVFVFPVLIRVYKVYKHKGVVETGEESSVKSRGDVEKAFGIVFVLVFVAAAIEALPLLIRWFHQIETSGMRGLVAGTGSGGALAIFTVAGKLLSNLGGLKQKIILLLVGLLGLVIPLVVALYVVDDLVYPVAGIEAEMGSTLEGELEALAKKGKPTNPEVDGPTPAYLVKPWAHEPMAFGAVPSLDDVVRLLPGVLLLILGGGLGAAGAGKLPAWKFRWVFTVVGIVVGAFVGYCILIGSSWLLARISAEFGFEGAIRPDVLVLSMTVVVLLYCWASIDVNLTGMLGLYRDRLAAAYLIGLRKKGKYERKDGKLTFIPEKDKEGNPTNAEEIFVEPDLDLEDLCGGSEPGKCKPSKAPFHIVNTALNLQGSTDPMLRDRGSDFFMFSKRYYGGHRTGYCPTGLLEKVFPQMDLPTAMAISAAAASPNAGRATSKPLVALMTLLNVRLGYWVPHPGRLHDWLDERGMIEDKKKEPELHHRWAWRIPPRALLLEMAGKVNERDKWINLSDGGHMENMAVYELLRRRCRYIICGDGEADPTLTFGGLAILMRSARIDMGIEIEILLDDLRLGDDRTSQQHAALGKIKYPPLEKGGKAEEGYLLYIKSSFTGNEDETMQEYRAKNADFPHESTADQFFDEGQFEAYRALGFHMADGLFPPWVNAKKSKVDWPGFKNWFHDLRADLAPRLSSKHAELQDQLRRIQKALVKPDYRDYFVELHPDLAGVDHGGIGEPDDAKPLTPEISYMVSQQLALMENAFVALNLDQPRNWKHEGNQGWRALFENWAQSDRFAKAYEHLGHLHSGRFQNFCYRNFGLPDAGKLWEMEQKRKKERKKKRAEARRRQKEEQASQA